MQRTVNLWLYLPEFLKEFWELDKVLLAEEPEFQLLADNLDVLQNDLFIMTATENGLNEYEKILGIKPGLSDSIDDRRTAVLTRWNDMESFTIRTLKKRIDAIQGNDQSVVEIYPENPYMLHIVCELTSISQITSVTHIIGSMVPANMDTRMTNEIKNIPPVPQYFGIALAQTGRMQAGTEQTDYENDWWLTDENGNIITDPQFMILFDDEVIA